MDYFYMIGEPDEEVPPVRNYSEEEIIARAELADAQVVLAKLSMLEKVDEALQPFRDFASKIAGTVTEEQAYSPGADGVFFDIPMTPELWAEWRGLTGMGSIPKEMFIEK